jgi:isoamylase
MLVSGDEIGRTQRGNNNAYCQDNEISWLNWAEADQELLAFTRQLIKLRNSHSVFSRKEWFKGVAVKDSNIEDIAWFLPDGTQMEENHWQQDFAKSVAMYLNGQGIHGVDSNGKEVIDDNFYLVFNAHDQGLDYKMPHETYGKQWKVIIDTSKSGELQEQVYQPEETVHVEGRSIVLLQYETNDHE